MIDFDRCTDGELLRATGRDPEAYGAFYRRHADWVFGVCMRRTRDAELAGDVAAEAFSAALIGAARFDEGRGSARSWLLAITLNKLADVHRRGYAERDARRRLEIPRLALDDEDLARIEQLGRSLEVDAVLAELPEDQRQAVRARVIDELAYPELASHLDISEAAARQRVSRGLATLRARLRGAR